ncbi:MAG: hypothetical protein Q7R77_03275 [Candidatus Daviesbacteria bacterium]|nr:hypothetical protein [Candidatus Daviesbacteria bacterium]
MIKVSAPGKIHLLGEHTVVYGKPALLTTIDLRVTVHLRGAKAHLGGVSNLTKIIEPIVKKELKISKASRFALKKIPPYELTITSDIPIGAGLGSSAAVSAAYIGALLVFLKVKWDLNLINKLTFEAEKVFHGNPSGADNKTVIFGGITVPNKLAKNFVLINTGKPKESTKEMIELAKPRIEKILNDQERLVKELLPVIQDGDEKKFIEIIRAGEKNLEKIGVVSPYAAGIIRKIEKAGGAAKICGAGGQTRATGILLTYHKDKKVLEKIAKAENLPYFSTSLGVEGVKLH